MREKNNIIIIKYTASKTLNNKSVIDYWIENTPPAMARVVESLPAVYNCNVKKFKEKIINTLTRRGAYKIGFIRLYKKDLILID